MFIFFKKEGKKRKSKKEKIGGEREREKEGTLGSLLLETLSLVSSVESIERMNEPDPFAPTSMHPTTSLFVLLKGSEGHPRIPK